jgi:ligand-binding sensor domain-containing protein
MKQRFTLLFTLTFLFISSAFAQPRSIENIGIGEISIIEMAGGNLWAGSATQGVGFYSGTAHNWTYYNHTTTPQFLSDTVTSIVAKTIGGQERVYIGTTKGIVQYKGGVWSNIAITSTKRISGISLVAGDTIWVSGIDSGLIVFDTAFNVISTFNTSNSTLPINQISSAQRGGRSCPGFCAGTREMGSLFTDNGSSYLNIDTGVAHFGLINNHVTVVNRDNICTNDRWLLGTQGGFSICPDSLPCQNFTTANGLPQNYITSISQDCNGNIWIGTADSGIVVYKNSTFTRVTTASGLTSNNIKAIAFEAGSCTGFIATADGNIAQVDTAGQISQVLTAISTVGASDISVNVYPQPSDSRANFVFGKTILNGEMYLTDINGRSVQTLSIRNTNRLSVDISALTDGLYFYHISAADMPLKTGKLQVTKK